MQRVNELMRQFNDQLTSNPGKLPKKVFILNLTEGSRLVLHGDRDRLADATHYTGPVDCTITCSLETIEQLLDKPETAPHLVMLRKIKFDNVSAMLGLAAGLNDLMAK